MKKIYINPGHSDTDPGAVGYETERRLNVMVSNHMKDYLLGVFDCEVRMNPGTLDSLSAIAADANSWGADLFVSNHFNAGGGDGYEALVYGQGRVPLGQVFEKHVKAIGQNSRGVKLRPGLAVLRLTNMPAVLNEGAFVDNMEDIQDWNEEAELKALGIAYAKAAAEFLGLEEKRPRGLPVLRRGEQGSFVFALQYLLKGYGYSLDADGDFGTRTESAVRAFQTAAAIDADGIVGAVTWGRLLG